MKCSCVSTSKYFIWKKFSIQVIQHTKNDFHLTSTTASNFKQSKISCISAIESWNQPRLKINSLTFYKMNFHTQNVSKKVFSFEWGAWPCVPIRERTSAKRLPPIQWKKAFWKHLSVKIHFVKSQGIYLESGLISA